MTGSDPAHVIAAVKGMPGECNNLRVAKTSGITNPRAEIIWPESGRS
jgi:hypothetical protein